MLLPAVISCCIDLLGLIACCAELLASHACCAPCMWSAADKQLSKDVIRPDLLIS
jgi:hypothetical protein